MQLRTEVSLRKLMHVWKDKPLSKLRFSEIQNALGWNSRKTSGMLNKAVQIGFVEKTREKQVAFYRSRKADYDGYFEALDFIKRIDAICLKDGLVQNTDFYIFTFSPIHILSYGIPDFDKLTPIEDEMLQGIFSRLGLAFADYFSLCDKINKRIEFEGNQSLPDSVKCNLFVKNTKDKTILNQFYMGATHEIYGDVLWDHIFYKIVYDLHKALVQGSLDLTGPYELMAVKEKIIKLAFNLSKKIYMREFPRPREKDEKLIESLRLAFFSLPSFYSKLVSNARSIVITPSPRTVDDYAEQVGRIIVDCYSVWSDPQFLNQKIVEKVKTFWCDLFQLDSESKTRKELFKEALINDIVIMRRRKQDILSPTDEEFLLKDSRLLEVFKTEEIYDIIQYTKNLNRRARRFSEMLEKDVTPDKIRQDSEWFTEKELKSFDIASNIDDALRFQKSDDYLLSKLRISSSKSNNRLFSKYHKKFREKIKE